MLLYPPLGIIQEHWLFTAPQSLSVHSRPPVTGLLSVTDTEPVEYIRQHSLVACINSNLQENLIFFPPHVDTAGLSAFFGHFRVTGIESK